MLLKFRVANYRSLRGEHELSFVATDPAGQGVRLTGLKADGKDHGVVLALGVFGANASGKSNLLAALRAMRGAVRDSFVDWSKKPGVPREPFALDPSSRDETTSFEVELLLGQSKTRFVYGFELSDERVEAEWLHAYPEGRRRVWFDREADRDDGSGDFQFPGEWLKGSKDKLVEFTRPNALFLTVGAALNNPQLSAVHDWFADNLWFLSSGDDVAKRAAYTRDLLLDPQRGSWYRERIEAMLQAADLGVTGIVVDGSAPTEESIRLLHRTGTGESAPLDYTTQESDGTHVWFAFLGPLLQALRRGTVLLADELDSSLHPALAAEVVRIFANPAANPEGAQLLFTTHDVTLLSKGPVGQVLGRDQVWIATKRMSGESELYPLTDAHPRPDENLERGYMLGRYGGVPRVSAGEVAWQLAQLPAEVQ